MGWGKAETYGPGSDVRVDSTKDTNDRSGGTIARQQLIEATLKSGMDISFSDIQNNNS